MYRPVQMLPCHNRYCHNYFMNTLPVPNQVQVEQIEFQSHLSLYFPGPLQDSAIWVDESQVINNIIGRNRVSSPLTSQDHDDPLGISNESNE